MAKSNKQLVNLAKGSIKKPVAEKVVKVAEKVLTPDEERDLKAKETVKSLLDGVDLSITKPKEDLLEVADDDTPPIPGDGGDIWLQEQVAALTSENENLRNELSVAKSDYQRIFNENQQIKNGLGVQTDGDLKNGILTIFHELQSNYMKMGFSSAPRQEVIPQGEPNFRIAPAAFINRLIMYFPFLKDQKRF
jgi:hypothetical protein